MDNTDISISSKSKTFVSTSNVEVYNKKTLDDEIRKLTTANIQFVTDKIKTKKARVNLEIDKTRLFDKKNSLIVKKEEFRAEIAILNAAGFSNPLIRGH